MIRVNRGVMEQALRYGQPLSSSTERAVGKTTGAILLAIGESYSKPGRNVVIQDPDMETVHQRMNVRDLAEDILSKLNLTNIRVKLVGVSVYIENNFSEVLVK
jgi:hypothetical protein